MEKRARKRGIMILSVMSAAGILIGIGCLAALRAAIGRLQTAPARPPQAPTLTAPPRLMNTSTLPYGRGYPAPTPSHLPTATPLPALPVLAGTPVPYPAQAISPENAGRVVQLARWGDGEVYQMAWSSDGQRVAVGTSIGIYLYDAQTLAQVAFWEAEDWMYGMVFSPDGSLLATGGGLTYDITIWRVADGSRLHTLHGHTDAVSSLVFAPNGETLASGSQDGAIKLWRVSNGALLLTLPEPPGMNSLVFSPDGRLLAANPSGGQVKVWNLADGALLSTFSYIQTGVSGLVFSPTGALLVTTGYDSGDNALYTLDLYHVPDKTRLWTTQGHGSGPQAFSPDGTRLAVAMGRTVELRRAADGELAFKLEGHADDVVSLDFSPDGTLLATGSLDKTVKLWQVSDGALLHTLEGHTLFVAGLDFSPDGARLASRAMNAVKLWRVSDGNLLGSQDREFSLYPPVAFSPDGKLVASASITDNAVLLWRLADGSLLRRLEGNTEKAEALAFSPDGTLLAALTYGNPARVWRVADGELLTSLQGVTGDTLAFSPDGVLLAVEEYGGYVTLRGVADWSEARRLDGASAGALAFSPDGRLLATMSMANVSGVMLWRVADGTLLRTLNTAGRSASYLSFSADGTALAAASGYDGNVRVWRISDGTLQRTLNLNPPETDYLYGIARLSPDWTLLATVFYGTTIQLWGFPDGRPLQTLEGHPSWSYALFWSPDGRLLASFGFDWTFRLWGIVP